VLKVIVSLALRVLKVIVSLALRVLKVIVHPKGKANYYL
jgi:hypothetical protein